MFKKLSDVVVFIWLLVWLSQKCPLLHPTQCACLVQRLQLFSSASYHDRLFLPGFQLYQKIQFSSLHQISLLFVPRGYHCAMFLKCSFFNTYSDHVYLIGDLIIAPVKWVTNLIGVLDAKMCAGKLCISNYKLGCICLLNMQFIESSKASCTTTKPQ